jgi:4-hydroxyacetophenone monooxygenase
LLEQGGFQLSQPTLPRTVPTPESMRVAIIGAGLAGSIAALAAAGISAVMCRTTRTGTG